MRHGILLLALAVVVSACMPVPTTLPRASTAAQSTLAEFMQARVDRDEPRVLELLTDSLKNALADSTEPIQPPLLQLSNPCWYRFETVAFEQTEPTVAHARMRMFEHFWSGDSGGSVPRSWEQDIILLETAVGWRVNELGKLENERDEPNEPHGETISACVVVRTTTP